MTRNEFERWVTECKEVSTIALIANDAFVMNSLGRCGVDYPTTFSLVWGDRIACSDGFPFELRKIVSDIIQEEEKKEESLDPWDKRLHGIVIDLLYVLYEKQVNDLVANVLGNK